VIWIVAAVVAALLAAAVVLGLRSRAKKMLVPALDDEFALAEPERIDLIFALGALGDESAIARLVRALDDPSEAVALAAARALTSAGDAGRLERFLAEPRSERAARIAHGLETLA
jgi:HEAT repeat protein